MRRRAARRRRASPPDFRTLVEAASNDEGWAFREIHDRFSGQVTAFVRAQLGADTTVDEIVNDVFLGVFRGLPRFEGDESGFRSWIFQITRNKINDRHRQTYRRVDTVDLDQGPDPASPDVDLDGIVSSIDDHLDVLTPDQRDVIVLRVIADLSIEEVAAILDKPGGAIKALQHRALLALRRHFSAEEVSP